MTYRNTATHEFQYAPAGETIETSRFLHPDDVLSASELGQAEKRAILASWLSDARAVENAPALRQLDNGAFVLVDDLLQALRSLDEPSTAADSVARGRTYLRHRPDTRIFNLFCRVTHRNDSDDDDPPPCPVGARPRDHGPTSGALAEQDGLIYAAA